MRQSNPIGLNANAKIEPSRARTERSISRCGRSSTLGETFAPSHTASETQNTTVDNLIINSLKVFSKDFNRGCNFGIFRSAISSVKGSGFSLMTVFESRRE